MMTRAERLKRLAALERKLGVTRASRLVVGYAERGPDGAETIDWPNGEPGPGDQALIVEFVEGEEAVTP
jgi:hypothetical protein